MGEMGGFVDVMDECRKGVSVAETVMVLGVDPQPEAELVIGEAVRLGELKVIGVDANGVRDLMGFQEWPDAKSDIGKMHEH